MQFINKSDICAARENKIATTIRDIRTQEPKEPILCVRTGTTNSDDGA